MSGAVPTASSIDEAPIMEAAPNAAMNDSTSNTTHDNTATVQGINIFDNYYSRPSMKQIS